MRKILIVLFMVLFSFPVTATAITELGLGKRNICTKYVHHQTHEGDHFMVAINNTIASGSTIQLLINTPAGDKHSHILITYRSTAEANITVFEGVTVSALGSALSATNHNRASSNVAGTAFTLYPTVTDWGTELESFAVHFGENQQGGEGRSEEELLLAPATLYIINGTSEAANNDFSLGTNFYESRDYY